MREEKMVEKERESEVETERKSSSPSPSPPSSLSPTPFPVPTPRSLDEQMSAFISSLSSSPLSPFLSSLPQPLHPILRYISLYGDFLLLGIFGGTASGLLGIGGGLVMTSYMAAFTDIPQLTAVATSLAAIVPTGV